MEKNLPAVLPKTNFLPAISDDYSLVRYIDYIQRFPILTATQEYEYATQWAQGHDSSAAEKLITSHLRMVVAVAYDLKNYGIPVSELIASGNLGLMQALQKFDPEKGFRFSTYAMFWIKAEMYDLIFTNWSMVKIGTSANKKKVFFNLSKAKRALGIIDGNMSPDQVKQIAEYLDVGESDVSGMAQRLRARDLSLNAPARNDSDSADVLSNLEDETDSIESKLEARQFRQRGAALLKKHLADLPERDRDILIARRMSDPVKTLEQLATEHKISRERVRQIEERAFAKLQKAILEETGDKI
jgi:RNA polymerase sigma-32 factor